MFYLDLNSGISGDMFMGALLDLGLDFNYLKYELGKLNIKDYDISYNKVNKKGVKAIKFNVVDQGDKKYRNYLTILKIIKDSKLKNNVKKIALNIFEILGKAESKYHKVPLSKVHFHEMGCVDTIIDVVGAAIGIDKLGMSEVYCSTVNLGGGKIKFSHGVFDVPAPATKEILKDFRVSFLGGSEFTTPTGAAVLKYLCKQDDVIYLTKNVGFGAGNKDLKWPNVLKIIKGEKMELEIDKNKMIETNIDNMNPEIYDYVIERLFKNGALDVYFRNIHMKKNRPGILLNVLCKISDTGKMLDIIFKETTTLGVRMYDVEKVMTKREIKKVQSKYGEVRVKLGLIKGKVVNMMPEFEDCKKIAIKNRIPLKWIYSEIIGKLYKK